MKSNGLTQCDSLLQSNADKTDTRIWLHVKQSAGQKKLILSPDTDVYHMGRSVVSELNVEVMIKLSPISSLELQILNTQALLAALNNNPKLAIIPQALIQIL